MVRKRIIITYLVIYLVAIISTLRYIGYISSLPSRWIIIGLLSVFYVLLAIEPWIPQRSQLFKHIYLAVQTLILIAITLFTTIEDFFGVPFMALSLQSMINPPRKDFRWIIIFSVISLIFVPIYGNFAHGYPLGETLLTVLLYFSIYFFVGSFMALTYQLENERREAELARDESKQLLIELQKTHEQLKIYSEKAEEAAVVQERNRLARELHDSVTQSLHSSTLFAEAGQRLLSSGDIERARGYMNRLGEISQQALREMRLLVYELRPLALREVGLTGALQQRLDAVERRSGVEVQFSMEAGIELHKRIEEELFWIAMEALNNALKHANPARISVALGVETDCDPLCAELAVIDDGAGFDQDSEGDSGGLGLIGMRERVQKLGGELTIRSKPGEGTQVRACVNLEKPSESPDAQETIP